METATTPKTHVRYAVHYNGRNYEYAFHSAKKIYLRNQADVINVLEYCVAQDLKKNLYAPDAKLYNFDVIRLVNDKIDENWETSSKAGYLDAIKYIVDQSMNDIIKRNS